MYFWVFSVILTILRLFGRAENTVTEDEMKNIAIVEDEQSEADIISEYIRRFERENGSEEFSVVRFCDANAFLDEYTGKFDLILLDINLPGINGMDTARELRQIDNKVAIIFVTNMAQYAVNGYEVDALDFIIKPVSYKDFSIKFGKAIKRIDKREDKKIPIVSQTCTCYVYLADILYIEVFLRKIVFHTTEGEFETYSTLKKIEPVLSETQFAKCYRSIIVNLNYVTMIKNDEVYLGDVRLLLSRNYKKSFTAALNEYNLGKKGDRN